MTTTLKYLALLTILVTSMPTMASNISLSKNSEENLSDQSVEGEKNPTLFITVTPLNYSLNTGTIQPIFSLGIEFSEQWSAAGFYSESNGTEPDSCNTNIAGSCSGRTFSSSSVWQQSMGIIVGYRFFEGLGFKLLGFSGLSYVDLRERGTYKASEGDIVYRARNAVIAASVSGALELSQHAIEKLGLSQHFFAGVQPIIYVVPLKEMKSDATISLPRSNEHKNEANKRLEEELNARRKKVPDVGGSFGLIYFGYRI